MTRALPVCAALVALVYVARSDGGPEPTETVIRLTVQPAAAPKPALRYQLLPELAEMEPGNAVLAYMKCFAEQHPLFGSKDVGDQREKWLAMPLKDLPHKEMRDYADTVVRQAHYASRLEHADWQTLIPLRRQGIMLLVPELQQMRSLADVLQVPLRGAIAARRFDDALVIAKTMFALSRHLGEHPTLIGNLVGLAVAARAVDGVSEMIGQPGSPNLYWALTTLPKPLINLRKGAQGDRVVLAGEFRLLNDHAPMSKAEIEKAVQRAQELHDMTTLQEGLAGPPTEGKPAPPPKEDCGKPQADLRDVRAWLAERAKNAALVDTARKRLVEYGLAADAVKSFPPLQVLLLDEKITCEVRRDAIETLMALPYWQAQALRRADRVQERDSPALYADLVGSMFKVQTAQVRLQQRIALLRCVEGLRLFAAAHDGKLPAKLADAPVPLPVDPVTGQPFVYTLQDGTASVRGTPPAGMEKYAGYNMRYEIKVAQ
jgi:hypothetical protein